MMNSQQASAAAGSPALAESLAELTDAGSYRSRASAASGVIAGDARICGQPVVIYATDPSVRGGALGHAGCELIAATITAGCRRQIPVVGLWSSGGAALQEGVGALDGVSRIFAAIVAASGRVPQVSVVHGPAAGGAAYGPALTDVVIMSREARIFVTGPAVIKKVTGQDVTQEQLGGAETHGRHSGVAHVTADSRTDAAAAARRIVGLLRRDPGLAGGSCGMTEPDTSPDRDPGALLPESSRRAYDMHPVIDVLLDEPGLELQPKWAPNIVTTLGRLDGRPVGVIANNPLRLGGCLDAAAGDKAARFVRMCDCFGVPLVVLVDVPGYLPGLAQEGAGVVRRGAKLLHAFAEARVPRVTVVLRKAYGGAYIAMNSRGLGATAVYAWPGAEVGVMDPEAAAGILYRRELERCDQPAARAELAGRLAAAYAAEAGGLPAAQERGLVDGIISPRDTRKVLAGSLTADRSGRGQHANIPL
jgi:acetyl-CoA/propionyl-CoA carboxylase carboxyl transferase subunit